MIYRTLSGKLSRVCQESLVGIEDEAVLQKIASCAVKTMYKNVLTIMIIQCKIFRVFSIFVV